MQIETENGFIVDTADIVIIKIRKSLRRTNGILKEGYKVLAGFKRNGYVDIGFFFSKKHAMIYANKFKE